MTSQASTSSEVRTGDADSERRVQQEAARLQAILDERARRSAEEQAETRARRIAGTIKWFKARIEDDIGLSTMHVCPTCLLGCAAGQIARFCPEGQALILANLRDRD